MSAASCSASGQTSGESTSTRPAPAPAPAPGPRLKEVRSNKACHLQTGEMDFGTTMNVHYCLSVNGQLLY